MLRPGCSLTNAFLRRLQTLSCFLTEEGALKNQAPHLLSKLKNKTMVGGVCRKETL
jgi:hypothetical protein